MSSIVQKLVNKQLIQPPSYVDSQLQYEVIMGSFAYGVSDDLSDIDIYGWCIPHKDMIFPHLRGEIPGFGNQIKRFDQYQQHHVKDPDKDREYDITIYNIVKYFQLCMENNPNMIDSLFAPQRCITYITPVGQMVRENRWLFLHKGSFHKYKGYAYSQLHKCKTKEPIGKRKETIEKYGVDTKFLYHVKRLVLQIEQILTEKDIDLERHREELKAIRAGEVSLKSIEKWFDIKEKELEKLYNTSDLPYKADESKIKQLLIDCLEDHFGSLSEAEYCAPDKYQHLLDDLYKLLTKYRGR